MDNNSPLFSINLKEIIRSIVNSLISSLLGAVGFLMNNKLRNNDFNLSFNDFKLIFSLAVITFLASVGNRYLRDANGNLVGSTAIKKIFKR